jgi:NDP-sugar pyrophosphorylase family protein
MKAMILAAGNGNRLRPLTDNIPKPMVPLHGKPLVEYTVEWLKRYGISDIAMNLHYYFEVIVDYFGDGSKWIVDITYSREEELLGTAGAIKRLEWFFDDAFLVIYGDNLSDCNISKLADFHHSKGGIGTIVLFRREDTSASGIAQLDDDARIVKFLEKPSSIESFSKLVNAGIYILKPSILEYIPDDQPFDFGRQLFPLLLSKGEKLYGYVMSEEEHLYWADTIESYQVMIEAIDTGKINL